MDLGELCGPVRGAHTQAQGVADKRPVNVLIVEDEMLVAMDMIACLVASGYAVLGPANSISAALRLLDEERPDVAILDLNIQASTILPVAERLQQMDVPMIITSAYDRSQLQRHSALGSAHFVSKPFEDPELVRAIEQCKK